MCSSFLLRRFHWTHLYRRHYLTILYRRRPSILSRLVRFLLVAPVLLSFAYCGLFLYVKPTNFVENLRWLKPKRCVDGYFCYPCPLRMLYRGLSEPLCVERDWQAVSMFFAHLHIVRLT